MSKKFEAQLRAFGMTGAQISSEIKKIERETGLNLRGKPRAFVKRKHEEFGSFEAEIRRDAAWMSEYYEIFYCLEFSIRRLINQTMQEVHGADWWDCDCVKEEIKKEVRRNQDNELNAAMTARSDDPLDYTTFGQLGEIITNNFEHFEPIFQFEKPVRRIMAQLNSLRGPIAHCSPLAPDERDRLELAVRDWFRIQS